MPTKTDDRFWERLLDYVDAGTVVPIVGRDLLVVQHNGRAQELYPTAARELATRLGVSASDLPEGGELNEVTLRFLRESPDDIEDVYRELKRSIEDIAPSLVPAGPHERKPTPAEIDLPAPLLALADIRPFKLFASTTFDTGLQHAINRKRFAGDQNTTVLSYWPHRVCDLDSTTIEDPLVFQLLGRLSAVADYAVTDEDVLEFVHSLQVETKRPERLFDALNEKKLLVVGCRFSDWLARFFLRIARGERLLRAHEQSFVADSGIGENSRLVYFLELLTAQVQVIEGLSPVAFVNELHSRWRARHPEEGDSDEPVPGPDRITPGAIFVSYASEDVNIARSLRDDLTGLPVPVWFDKNEIQGGDLWENRIKDAIDEASLFVPLITKSTLDSAPRYFRLEWNYAAQRSALKPADNNFVVPVVADDTSPSETVIPRQIRERSWLSYPDNRDQLRSLAQTAYRKYQKVHSS